MTFVAKGQMSVNFTSGSLKPTKSEESKFQIQD